MARVAPKDRLQPSLLDRLTDEDPSTKKEAPDQRHLSIRELRECVLRDLAWLLNTGNLDMIEDLDDYPLVLDSTLNYGIPHLAGTQASNVEAREMERLLREAVMKFEPRILPDTVKIKLDVTDQAMTHNAVRFFIEGMLWAEPAPWHLYLKSEIDLEIGACVVSEVDGREEH